MDVTEQIRRWESIANHVEGQPRLEHTAHAPTRHNGHGYVVTAMRRDDSVKKGKSRQAIYGPVECSLDEFLSQLEERFVQHEAHPLFR